MNNEFQQHEWIDQYLKGLLSDTEKSRIETKIQSEKDFARMVELQEAANEVVMIHQLQSLQSKMSADLKHYGRFKITPWIWFTGALVLVSTSAYWVLSNPESEIQTDTKRVLVPEEKVQRLSDQNLPSPAEAPTFIAKRTSSATLEPLTETIEIPVLTSKTAVSEEDPVKPNEADPVVTQVTSADTKQPCSNFRPNLDVATQASCSDRPTGKLSLVPQEKFQYSLDGKKYTNQSDFLFLSPGQYTLRIRNEENCMAQKDFMIEEKNCNEHQYAFNPQVESWKIPAKEGKTGILEIKDRAGRLVHTVRIAEGGENEWNGVSLTGQVVAAGYYTFRILYSDTSEERGFITIVN